MRLTDVTLREAEQMPGRSYSVEQKVEAGQALDRLGLTCIQAGFPAAGSEQRRTVERLTTSVETPVAALARAVPADVDAALATGADVVDVFVSLSNVHLRYVLDLTVDEAVDGLTTTVHHALDRGMTVRVSFMDAFRTPLERLAEACTSLPDASAFVLADTVGGCTPTDIDSFFRALTERGVSSELEVHAHDDLGLAVANTLAAGDAGATGADVCVASLGDRAGNAALEEVVVATAVTGGPSLSVNESQLVPVCYDVLDALGESIDPRQPVIGREAMIHESGIHTAGVLAEPSTFESYDPTRFGGERTLLFSARTGATAAHRLLERADCEPTDTAVERLRAALREHGPVDLPQALELAKKST